MKYFKIIPSPIELNAGTAHLVFLRLNNEGKIDRITGINFYDIDNPHYEYRTDQACNINVIEIIRHLESGEDGSLNTTDWIYEEIDISEPNLHPITDLPEVGRRIIITVLVKGNQRVLGVTTSILNGQLGYWSEPQIFIVLSGLSNIIGWRYDEPATPEDKGEKVGIDIEASPEDFLVLTYIGEHLQMEPDTYREFEEVVVKHLRENKTVFIDIVPPNRRHVASDIWIVTNDQARHIRKLIHTDFMGITELKEVYSTDTRGGAKIRVDINTAQTVIMSDSSAAAVRRTGIVGWVSRHGRFFGKEERLARFDGCTHRPCETCESPTEKAYTHCKDCRDKRATERYNKLEYKDHDGETPLYSHYFDKHFFSIDELNDEMIDEEIGSSVLDLVICVPVNLSLIHEDHWEDDLFEDNDLPVEVADALEELNQAIKDAAPVAWTPGKYRTSIKLEKS